MLHQRNRVFLVLFVVSLILLISSCRPGAPAEPTITPVPTSTKNIATLIADPSYMDECKQIYPNSSTEQVGYKEVYPGRTDKSMAEDLLGKPLKVYEINETTWEYADLDVVLDDSLVKAIFVAGDGVTTLEDMISQFGCPDVVYALDVNEEPQAEYSQVTFLYYRIGLIFTIDHIPAKLNDTITKLTYFEPGTLEDFTDQFRAFAVPDKAKPIPWAEALR